VCEEEEEEEEEEGEASKREQGKAVAAPVRQDAGWN
jgi:hypothetical protein